MSFERRRGQQDRALRAGMAAVLLIALGSCRTERDIQRDIARDLLTPAPVAPTSTDTSAAPARSMPVRVWVDAEYQRENLHWRANVEAQFERANQLLAPQLGIRLTIADIRHWVRRGSSPDLHRSLDELVDADDGAGVEWVVGYLPASTAAVPGSVETLGMSGGFGKHFVVKSMIMAADREEVARMLRALPEEEREKVMVDRRLHRETVLLLHEWAHTLGAFHDRDNDSIMAPGYDRAAFRFYEAQIRIIRLGLSWFRSPQPDAHAAWARAYRAEVERARAEAWSEDTVTQALSWAARLESSAAGARPPSPAPIAPTSPLPVSPAATRAPSPASGGGASPLLEADLADRLGDPARAWALAAPAVGRLPDAPYLRTWACHLQRRAGTRVEARCRDAPPLSPAVAAILFTRVLIERGDRSEAVAAADRAEQWFGAAGRAAPPLAWAELADALAGIGACTAAERNAARAPGQELAARATAACVRTRGRALLARGAPSVPADREPEYVSAVLAGRDALDQRRFDDALSAAFALERSFPAAAGGPWLRCTASALGRKGGAAVEACRTAEQAAPGVPGLSASLGLAEGNQKHWPEARDALRRAIEQDPLDMESWARLAFALRELGDVKGLEELGRRHRERFGMALAPEW